MESGTSQSGSGSGSGDGSAGGGTGAGGYNIPFSLSAASTYSVPQSLTAPTYFNFGAGARQGGDIASGAESYAPATATSSAAQRDSSATTGAQSGALGAIALPTKYTGIAIVAIVAYLIWRGTR